MYARVTFDGDELDDDPCVGSADPLGYESWLSIVSNGTSEYLIEVVADDGEPEFEDAIKKPLGFSRSVQITSARPNAGWVRPPQSLVDSIRLKNPFDVSSLAFDLPDGYALLGTQRAPEVGFSMSTLGIADAKMRYELSWWVWDKRVELRSQSESDSLSGFDLNQGVRVGRVGPYWVELDISNPKPGEADRSLNPYSSANATVAWPTRLVPVIRISR